METPLSPQIDPTAFLLKRELWGEKDRQVIKSLRRLGVDNHIAEMALELWTENERAKLSKHPLDSIRFELKQAWLYEDAGLIVLAKEHLREAANHASLELMTVLYAKILDEIKRLENRT